MEEERYKQYRAKYRENHREQARIYAREYYRKNKERCKKYSKKYYQQNKEEYSKNRKLHKKQINQYAKEYRRIHKKQIKLYARHYGKKRRRNLKYKLSNCFSTLIRRSLKNGKNGKHWESYVDFTQRDLEIHLEKQFNSTMSFDNHGTVWEIDHIIPVSVFNFDSYDDLDFKRCWTLENLRPLEKYENRQKYNKINGSFQLSLKI